MRLLTIVNDGHKTQKLINDEQYATWKWVRRAYCKMAVDSAYVNEWREAYKAAIAQNVWTSKHESTGKQTTTKMTNEDVLQWTLTH